MIQTKGRAKPLPYRKERKKHMRCLKTILKKIYDYSLDLDIEALEDGIVSTANGMYIGSFHTYRGAEVLIDNYLTAICEEYNIELEELKKFSISYKMTIDLFSINIEGYTIKRTMIGYVVGKRNEMAIVATDSVAKVFRKLYLSGRIGFPTSEVPGTIKGDVQRDLILTATGVKFSGLSYRCKGDTLERVGNEMVYEHNINRKSRVRVSFQFDESQNL